MARILAVIALAIAIVLPASASTDRKILLFHSFAGKETKERPIKPKRSRLVAPDFSSLEAPPLAREGRSRVERRLTAAIFDDVILHIELDRVERNAVDAHIWSGRVEGDESSSVTLVIKEQQLTGSIWTSNGRYAIEPVNGAHEALELDTIAFPDESEPVRPVNAFTTPVANDAPMASDSGAVIDVLVVYTDDLRASLGSTAAAQAAASNAIAATNNAYQNSVVTPRVRLVGTAEVSFDETGSLSSLLSALRNSGDGSMDEVHALRNALGADSVALLALNGGGSCGVAYLMTSPSAGFAVNAFAVVANDCAVGNLSFPHELGHNYGLEHDRYVSPNGTPAFAYGFGYVDVNLQFRDIMAYANACGCQRIQYFSNPRITYLSRPLGVSFDTSPSTAADNARALNDAASVVANWRQTVVPPTGGYTPATFTDNPLIAGSTIVRLIHITELRTAIDAYRSSVGLGAATWTPLSVGSLVSASHLTEMRTALQQALPAATFTSISTGSTIQAVHVQELRNYLD